MIKLFSNFKVNNTSFKNRVVMAPMCTYRSDDEGKVKQFHVNHYVSRAMGDVSLIILEATAVQKRGRISNRDLGIWSDDNIEGLKNLASNIKEYNCVVGIQLAHAGRKCACETEETIYAPSPLQFNKEYKVPKEMTLNDIEGVVKSFKDAARRAKIAGFDFIEIHSAHGYLLSEFLSPLTNKRTDYYGGTYENRVRLLGEVIEGIRDVFDGTLSVRVSAHDYMEQGNTPLDIANMINLVKDKGIDIINVSSGAVVDEAVMNVYPGYQVKHGEIIREETGLPVIVGGLIFTGIQAEEILCNNRGDMVYLGRELLRNPNFILKAKEELDNSYTLIPDMYTR